MNPNDNAKRNIGAFLKTARQEAHLSTEEAATHLAIADASVIHEIEAGHLGVTLTELYAFANIYNIGPDQLMTALFELTELDPMSQVEDLERVLRDAK